MGLSYEDGLNVYASLHISNIAQVSGGERELRTMYLKPFNRACVESLAIMTAYSSYDGIPAVANSRKHEPWDLMLGSLH